MIKKIGSFLEEHVEKIILIVVGLLCSWLLITRVLLSPNVVTYADKTFSPGNIDTQILNDAINVAPQKNNPDPDIVIPRDTNYAELFASPLRNVIIDLPPFVPPLPTEIDGDGMFQKPVFGRVVTKVDVEHYRSAVYEPTAPVTRENPYQESDCEPNDLDFVTVEALLDMAKINDELKRCFLREVSNELLVDPCNAKPIFASVNLQRQKINADGSESDWENVPRAKIDYNRNLFKVVEKYSDLPFGGLLIYKYQLDDQITQLELLQPEAYHVASAKDEWLTPALHREFLSAQKKDEQEARRIARETEDTKTTTDTGGRRGRDTRSTTTGGGINQTLTGTTTQRRGSRNTRDTTTNIDTTTTRRRGRTDETDTRDTVDVAGQEELKVYQVYDDFEAAVVTPDTDLSKMSEPMLIWAHDDTVVPGNVYRYRMRVGLLNPVADGEEDEIIFWSDFTNPTSLVKIHGKIYFFPGTSVQEAAKTLSISVYKLVLGYWYRETFERVGQGEMIGDIVDIKPKKSTSRTDTTTVTADDVKEPETIDFTTGAVLMDLVPVSELSGGSVSSPKLYYDMLYSYDGKEILHMPVTNDSTKWPPDMREAYSYVQEQIGKKREAFRDFGESEIQLQQIRSGQEYRERGIRNRNL
ncbi:MAG: hypothetical protein JW787_01480 [Sedimentisphaerales bacterium]|nr:hypothetical protein [Sedimentisphaerales bacterium]